MRRLPSIIVRGKEWTMDERLHEFRYLVFGETPEFVPFDSEKGDELMDAFVKAEANGTL
jgi:hypothetical protein